MYVHMQSYVNIYTCMYKCNYLRKGVVYVQLRIHTITYTCMYVNVQLCMHVSVPFKVQHQLWGSQYTLHMHIYIYVYIHTYIYIYIYI